jgi:hypothetical protein
MNNKRKMKKKKRKKADPWTGGYSFGMKEIS